MCGKTRGLVRRIWLEKIRRCVHATDAQKRKLVNAIDFVLVGPSREEIEALPNARIHSDGRSTVRLRLEGTLWPPSVTLIVEFKGDAATVVDIDGLQGAEE